MSHQQLPIPTKLRLRWLLWRHRWTFQWAHKPLCDRFARDVVRLGPMRLCRSCLLLYAGLIGAAAAVAIFRPVSGWLLPAVAAAMGVTLGLSIPRIYRHMPRPARDLLRLMAGALTPMLLWALVGIAWPLAGAGAAVGVILHLLYRRLRRRGMSDPCTRCDQLSEGRICPGFAHQARCLRHYDQAATDLLLATGYRPQVLDVNPAAPFQSGPGGLKARAEAPEAFRLSGSDSPKST